MNPKGQTAQWPKKKVQTMIYKTLHKENINIVHVDFLLSAFQACLFLNTDTQINVRIQCSTSGICTVYRSQRNDTTFIFI